MRGSRSYMTRNATLDGRRVLEKRNAWLFTQNANPDCVFRERGE
jgi:hypothetical protein